MGVMGNKTFQFVSFIISCLLCGVLAGDCNTTIILNTTYIIPIQFGGSYVSGDSCRITVKIPSDHFVKIMINPTKSPGANSSITLTNAANDVYTICDSCVPYVCFPPTVANVFINVANGNILVNGTIRIFSNTIAAVVNKNTTTGQQAFLLYPEQRTANIYTSTSAVVLNVIPTLGVDYSLLNTFIYDGDFATGTLLGTLYSFTAGQAVRSTKKTLTVFCADAVYSTAMVAVNDATNMVGFKSSYMTSSWFVNIGLNQSIDASKGAASLTLIYPYLLGAESINFVLKNIVLTDSTSNLQVYAGTPLTTPPKSVRLATYSSSNIATQLPQYFNMPVITFVLNKGNAHLEFSYGQVGWMSAGTDRKGFISTNLYPFSNERQLVKTEFIGQNDLTQFVFNVRGAPAGQALNVTIWTSTSAKNETKSYSLSSASSNITFHARQLAISIPPVNKTSTGALVDLQIITSSSLRVFDFAFMLVSLIAVN